MALASVLAFMGTVEAGESRVRIEVRESVAVNTREILLGEIARIEAPESLSPVLTDVAVGFAPDPGETDVVDGGRLKARILSDALVDRSYEVEVPETVTIVRESQEVSPEALKDLFGDRIRHLAGSDDFVIRDFTVRGLEPFPRGRIELVPENRETGGLGRRFTLYVDVYVDGMDAGRLTLSGQVDLYDTVVCATRRIGRGEVLSTSDVVEKRMNVSSIRDGYLASAGEAEGMMLRTSIATGAVITGRMVEEPPLVERGEVVRIVALVGNLRIMASGVARSDGRKGERIEVENLGSGKNVTGVVTGRNQVDVLF